MSLPQPAPLELLDIVMPVPASPWPPSLAAGLAAFTVLALLALVGWQLWRYWHRRKLRRAALVQLDALSQTSPTLLAVSELLKRIAISAYGRTQVAALSGDAWFEFLSQSSQQKADFNAVKHLWLQGIYQTSQVADDQDIALAKRWIKSAIPVKVSRLTNLPNQEQTNV
ncbi:DUF4381 domain-containing protein [Motilimonas pumila]|uniref:DUF4381 domain-containing protein n=1 Tax=Motilimonas pumila TaxID=2303987 RepID=A0A418YGD2_9GAMM|nr:DUF4381 domain-containing protein [Motilimonas pumila]RJG48677.1 DUF4381 domain-containing protein [Motilimonas pumila]